MFGFQRLTPSEVNFWVVVPLALGITSGLYILIFGAPDSVLSSEGKRTVPWNLHYSEQRYGRFMTAGALIGLGLLCAALTKIFPYGSPD